MTFASAQDYVRLCAFSGPAYTRRVLIWLERENKKLYQEVKKLLEEQK